MMDQKNKLRVIAYLFLLLVCVVTLLDPSLFDVLSQIPMFGLWRTISWIILTFFVAMLPERMPLVKLRHRNSVNGWAFIFALITILVAILAGLIDGLGRSPYDHSLKGLILNGLIVGSAVLAKERIRCFCLAQIAHKEDYIKFFFLAGLFSLAYIPLGPIHNITNYQDLIKFTAEFLLPEVAKNLLATYLTFVGGWQAAIIYMGMFHGFMWFSPILPDLQWITAALTGILTPVFSLMAMHNIYEGELKRKKSSRREIKEGTLGWVFTIVFSIATTWFSLGVFPVYPTVVATGSMEPLIKPGDIVIMTKVKKLDEFSKGDIIQFKRDGVLISHRVIQVIEQDKKLCFQTKGDNNSGPDTELVQSEQIKGKLLQVIPKIGWPTLLLKRNNDIPLAKVQF